MAAFAAVALLLSTGLALLAYEVTRGNVLSQRATAAERQAYVNARLVRSVLRTEGADIPALLASLQLSTDGAAVLRVGQEWFGTAVGVGRDDVPHRLSRIAEQGNAARQRIRVRGAGPQVVVAVPLPAVRAVYFEFVPLTELEQTLKTLAAVLATAAAATTAIGAAAGRYLSSRVLRPLRRIAETAAGIGGGRLDERLEAHGDTDLQPLVDSFNGMVDALQARIEREARFASDASHELRAPLAAMSSALSVARRRAPAGTEDAFDVLTQRIASFNQLVEDLLEISRLDAGVGSFAIEDVAPADMITALCAGSGRPVEIVARPEAPSTIRADRRRLAQMVTNLLENADNYGGGARRVIVGGDPEHLRIAVEDDGPGVPEHERVYIFERFARGDRSGVPGAAPGTGLGLALVSEHARLHGGRVWVEDSPSGGARFVIELPVREP